MNVSPAKFGDKIQVTTKIIYMSCVKIKFEYEVTSKLSEKVLVTGKTVHVWTNKKIKPINIEKASPEIYMKLQNLIESTNNALK